MKNWSDRTTEGNFNSQFLADQGTISDNMVVFLNRLSDLFYAAGTNEYTPSELNQSVDSLEDWVTSNYSVSIDEDYNCSDGGAMLAICSITKHSYNYWYSNYDENEAGKSTSVFGRVWRAVKIASADAYGFVVDGWSDDGSVWEGGRAVQGAGERSHNAGNP